MLNRSIGSYKEATLGSAVISAVTDTDVAAGHVVATRMSRLTDMTFRVTRVVLIRVIWVVLIRAIRVVLIRVIRVVLIRVIRVVLIRVIRVVLIRVIWVVPSGAQCTVRVPPRTAPGARHAAGRSPELWRR
jgi:hypothetical protein